MVSKLTLLIICLKISSIFSIENDYYWRKYPGYVPQDAVVAGNKFGYDIYIGRAPFETRGVLVGPLLAGLDYIVVTHYSDYNNDTIHQVDNLIEVLCSPNQRNFVWVSTNAETLLQIEGLVDGGFHYAGGGQNGVLYIGKALWNGDDVVGKVVGYHQGDDQKHNRFFFSNGTDELSTGTYAVLTYQ